jgi:hypothetical protein
MSASDDSEQSAKPARGASRARWQMGIRTLILSTALVAVWMSVHLDRGRIAALESRIAAMRPMARELIVDDPTRIAVVRKDELWYDDNRWEISLPEGEYRVGVATRDVDHLGWPRRRRRPPSRQAGTSWSWNNGGPPRAGGSSSLATAGRSSRRRSPRTGIPASVPPEGANTTRAHSSPPIGPPSCIAGVSRAPSIRPDPRPPRARRKASCCGSSGSAGRPRGCARSEGRIT